MPAPPQKPLIQRLASRGLALCGVRFYNLLYGERSLLEPIPIIVTPPGVRVGRASQMELDQLIRRTPSEQDEPCRKAREIGSECWIAWHHDRVAGYSWVDRKEVNLLGWRLFELPDSGAYTYNSFVWPEHRGRRIFQRLTEVIYRQLQAEGFSFSCNLVDRSNVASIGARRRFAVVYQPAPVVKIPGKGPFLLGRSPKVGAIVKGQLTARIGQSSPSKSV